MPRAPTSEELWVLILERIWQRDELLVWIEITLDRPEWQLKLNEALQATEKEIDLLFQTQPVDTPEPI